MTMNINEPEFDLEKRMKDLAEQSRLNRENEQILRGIPIENDQSLSDLLKKMIDESC